MDDPITAERLDRIRKRVEAAPKGPWVAERGYPQIIHNHGENILGEFYEETGGFRAARFVAAARTDVPDLLAEVDRLRAEVDRLLDENVNAFDRIALLEAGVAE